MDKFKKFIYSFSYKGIREKKLKKYIADEKKYLNMAEKEFSMEYIETCALYEHKKMMFTVVIISFLILFVTNVGSLIFDFIKSILLLDEINSDIMKLTKH